jgi:hypothetical protein
MKRKEIDSLEMIESVIAFLEAHLELIANNPAVMAKLTELKAHAATVKTMKPVQLQRGKEDHAVKITERESLVELIKSTTDGLKAVAVATNNTALKSVCDYPQSSLKDMRENDLVNLALQLVAKAKEHEDELKTWNVQPEETEQLNDLASGYLSQNVDMNLKKDKSIQATSSIIDHISDAMQLLNEEMDVMLAPFKRANPDFFNGYQLARQITHHAATHSNKKTATDAKE